MKTTVTAAEAKSHFTRLLRQVEAGETIGISKRDETVAFLIPRERLEILVETLEVLSNPAAMRARVIEVRNSVCCETADE